MHRVAQLMLKGALASYLMLYALDIKSYPEKWGQVITGNVGTYAEYGGMGLEGIEEVVASWLTLYCQWLVLMSLMILSGLRSGRVLGWLTLLMNLLLCWNETEFLFIGTYFPTQAFS